MSNLVKAGLIAAISGASLLAHPDQGFATEPGNFANYLPGTTMGAILGAAPPPGLYLNSTAFWLPMGSGNGNTTCGPACKTHYNGVGDSITLTWGSGLKFLGATYYPTVQLLGYQAQATTTPYPPGGGPLQSPVYGNTLNIVVGNAYVNPLNFSWDLGHSLFVSAGLGFVAPIGTSYAGSTLPDYWAVRPRAAVSYLADGWNVTVGAIYDINMASRGNTGAYQAIARNPATPPATAAFFSGPANPGDGYTSGNTLYIDWTATKKFDKWEFGPVGFLRWQTNDDSPGGINPATRSAWTCAQLTAAALPRCGKDVAAGAGLLIGYNFGPVDMKFIYAHGFYAKDTPGANTDERVFLKTSFRLWAPDEPPKKPLITK
jgi:Putative MetA-pathway of phenol degradation